MNKPMLPINRKASLFLVSSLALGFPLSAQAANLCGQTITADTKLDADQSCFIGQADGIAVGADNITLDCDGHTIVAPNPIRGPNSSGIVLNGRKGVTVKNCNVTAFTIGISLANSSRDKIINNNLTFNGSGISLSSSSHNSLRDNTVNNNRSGGIFLQDSSDNRLTENTANNNVSPFPGPISVPGIALSSSSHNRLIANTTNNNQAEGIILSQSSDNNRLTDNTANENGTDGIEVENSSRNKVRDNVANNNGKAGGTESSGNPAAGFSIEGSAAKNKFTDNDAEGNAQFDALQLGGADNVFRDNDFGTSSGL